MAKIVGLPKLSPTMEEGTLARWAKKEGDTIAVDELIAEIETDKATMEWRAFDRGVLLKIIAPEGSVLAPEAPVAIVGEAGEDISSLLASVGAGAPPEKDDAKKDEAKKDDAKKDDANKKEAAPAADTKAAPAESKPAKSARAAPARPDGRVLASPLVRKIAREHDLDLRTVQGSGPGGRIIKRDVDAALSAPRAKAPAASGERQPPRVEKLSSMRRTIARRLTESKQTVPHFYLTIDVDAGPLADARAKINAALEADGEKVSVNDLIIKACAVALRRVPNVNASFAGDSIHYHQVVDVSVAVAIPDGLVTPVIRDADKKGVREIARDVKELAGRAKNKKLTPEEMTGGTFSVSNLGMYGIEDFSAVINPPEGAILAVGTLREEPVVKDGAIVAGKRMRMTLSCDHRVVDGALGAEWLKVLRGLLEQPVLMLI
jgi:pyruvate dehydrogenase E2 component (dihydrolipoamide acetyltransferase)